MPYSKISDLPSGVKDNLPSHAATIYLNAFNSAKKEGKDDATAAKIGWSAIHTKYHKGKDGKWVSNSLIQKSALDYIAKNYAEVANLAKAEKAPKTKENIIEFSMFISKARLDNDGKMLWDATGSDTSLDSFKESMSIGLYKSFIKNIDKGINLPIYLSLAHYSRLGGKGEAGVATEVFIDGNTLKAKGYFHDTPLGRSVYNAIRQDRRNNVPADNRVRISIGFYDRMHQHSNGVVWKYEPLKPCSQCALGIGGKTYLDGILEHFAVTRVPVNKRTDIVAKSESETMTTRYEDALSIVGNSEIVDTIEKAAQDERRDKSNTTSNLVEKAKGDQTPVLIKPDNSAKPEHSYPGTTPATDAAYGMDLNIPQIQPDKDGPTVSTYEILSGLPRDVLMQMLQKMNWDGSLEENDDLAKLVNQTLNELTDRSATVKGKEVMANKPEKKTKKVIAGENSQTAKLNDIAGHTEFSETTDKAAARKDVTPADKKEAVSKYGDVKYADEENKKYPIDTAEHIRAAWNYINKEANAAKYGGKVGGIKAKIVAAWKDKIDKNGPPSAQKSDVVEKCDDDDNDYDDYKPFGGAITFDDAKNYLDAARLESNVYQTYSIFGALASNILSDDDSEIGDKLTAMQGLLSEFNDKLDPKELMKMSEAERVNRGENVPVNIPTNDGTSTNDTQPDIVKVYGQMAELIGLVRQLIERPASVAQAGTPIGPEPKGSWDENSPAKADPNSTVSTTDTQNKVGNNINPGPNGVFDENSPMRSLVSDFEKGLANAVGKSGTERLAAFQSVITQAAEQMKQVHLSLAEKEPVSKSEGQSIENIENVVNRSLDEKLVPMQATIAELVNVVKGLQVGKAVPVTKVEVPQMKSLTNYTQPPVQKSKGMSILDIATATTFGTR